MCAHRFDLIIWFLKKKKTGNPIEFHLTEIPQNANGLDPEKVP